MPEPITVTVDAKGMPLPPIDPNVTVPASVKRAAERAEALHKQAYTPQPDPMVAVVSPQPDPASTLAPVTAAVTEPSSAPPDGDRATWDAAKWMQHAKSMEGRFKQSQDTISSLQNTMTEMGDELVRAQSTLQRPVVNQTAPPPVPQSFITKEDVDTFGEDFLNVAQRAALQAVQPKLSQLEQQNQELRRRLQRTTIQTIEAVLDSNVPNWPQINLSPKFKNWLRIRDIYSGRVRKELLDEAHRAADAARVLQFFKGFLAEEEATGSTEFLPALQPSPQAAPHVPAFELQSLATPGHVRPAQGTPPNASTSEPMNITRAQIAKFYDNVRKGVYVGREQDYHNDQAIIFECQRAGRVR